jgi:hypothetical protein
MCVLVTLFLEMDQIDAVEHAIRDVYALQEHEDAYSNGHEARILALCLRGDVLLRRQDYSSALALFSNLLNHCVNDEERIIVTASIANAQFGLGNVEAAATLSELGLLGMRLDSVAPVQAYGQCRVVRPSVHRERLLRAMGCATPTSGSRPDGASAPGTPPPAGPTRAAASAPTTPDTDVAAIAAAAAALLPGWVPPPNKDTNTVYASSHPAPYAEKQGPEQLLEVADMGLAGSVLALSQGGAALQQGSPLFVVHVVMPYESPAKTKHFVSAATVLPSDGLTLSATEYSEVVSRCVESLAPQAMVSLGILVRQLIRPRKTAFDHWSAPFDVVASNIASAMSRAAELKRLFAQAGYRECFLKHKPPGDGFQQFQIAGFTSTGSTGDEPVLVATILVVIPQDAGDHPCRRVADCLKNAKAHAGRPGSWVFVVVIDVGKVRNKSGHRSFGTPPPS